MITKRNKPISSWKFQIKKKIPPSTPFASASSALASAAWKSSAALAGSWGAAASATASSCSIDDSFSGCVCEGVFVSLCL